VLRAISVSFAVVCSLLVSQDAPAADSANGERLFGACAACHSLEAGRHLTGPSLAGVYGRKAGTAEGFRRYSDALKSSNLVWSEDTLDAWLADPKALVPGNLMAFRGIEDAQARGDIIAFLKSGAGESTASSGGGGMMGGMMGAPALEDLKKLAPQNQVEAIAYCGDTYRVSTATGQTFPFWEFNLRFKTDSSDKGPAKGRPALLPASMMGDRAFVVFADPAEISAFIKAGC
jgi:cytochrome c